MAELAFKEQDGQSTLIESVRNPRVQSAGVFLIGQHRRGKAVQLEVLGRPQEALVSLSEQIEVLGVTHEMSADLIEALRLYMVSLGAEFSTKASAKPVYLNLQVADGLPECRFENSVTEVTCIGTEGIQVQGVSGQNVRATISGTATTSNAADVDAMFANVQGLRLWLRCEAPTKEDLDGLMTAMELALAGVAQAVGGSMSAEGFKKLLETLEAEGALTPQMEELIASMIALQKTEELGLSKVEIGELIQNISTLIAEGQANGLIPAAFIEATTKALGELASNDVMRDFLIENGFDDLVASNDNVLSVEDRIAELMEQLDTLQSIEGLDPALTVEIQEMVESLKEQLAQDNADPAAILEIMSEQLMDIASREDLPQAVFEGIGDMLPEIAALKQEIAEAGVAAPDLSNPEAMLAMLEDIAAKIEAGEIDLNDVPPELMEVIETLGGVEALIQEKGREARLDAVAAAIDTPDGSDLGIAMAAAIDVLSDPAMVEQLPPALQESVAALTGTTPETPSIIEVAALSASEEIDASVNENIIDRISTNVDLSRSFANSKLFSASSGPAQTNAPDIAPVAFVGGVGPVYSGGGGGGGGSEWSFLPVITPANPAPSAPPSPTENIAPDPVAPVQNKPDEPKKDGVVVVSTGKHATDKARVEEKPEEDKPTAPENPKAPGEVEAKGPNDPGNKPNDPQPAGPKGPCGEGICPCPEFNEAAGAKTEIQYTPEQVQAYVQSYKQEMNDQQFNDAVTYYGGEAQFVQALESLREMDSTARTIPVAELVIIDKQRREFVDFINERGPITMTTTTNEAYEDEGDYPLRDPSKPPIQHDFGGACECGKDHSLNPLVPKKGDVEENMKLKKTEVVVDSFGPGFEAF